MNKLQRLMNLDWELTPEGVTNPSWAFREFLERNSLFLGEDDEATAAKFAKEAENEKRRFRYKLGKLKKCAEAVGLECWGVLDSSECTAEQFKTFELALKNSEIDFTLVHPTVSDSYAGWSVRHVATGGNISISASKAAQFLKAGRGDAARLEAILRLILQQDLSDHHLKRLTLVSRAAIPTIESGYVWLSKWGHHIKQRVSLNVLRVLGRVTEDLRWPLIRKLKNIGTITRHSSQISVRDLDWANYKLAKSNRAARFDMLPYTRQFKVLFGFDAPQGMGVLPLAGFKLSVFRELCPIMGLSMSTEGLSNIGYSKPLLDLVRLFGDSSAIKRFVKDSGFPWTKKGIHDAGQFQLSGRGDWTPAKWSAVCLRHPELVKYARDFGKIEATGLIPQSLKAFRLARLQLEYPEIVPGFEALAHLCMDEEFESDVFAEHQSYWQSVKVKHAEFLPQIRVSGSAIGLSDDWQFLKLEANDIRGPLLGQLSGCCQHLSGAGADSARHGVESPYSAFYVVTFRERIYAQSWAWLNVVGGVVFDSIESRFRSPSEVEPVAKLFKAALEAFSKMPLGISAVYLGCTHSGITNEVKKLLETAGPLGVVATHAPVDGGGYYDGQTHRLVQGTYSKKKVKFVKVEGYRRTRGVEVEPPAIIEFDARTQLLNHFFEDPDVYEAQEQRNIMRYFMNDAEDPTAWHQALLGRNVYLE